MFIEFYRKDLIDKLKRDYFLLKWKQVFYHLKKVHFYLSIIK